MFSLSVRGRVETTTTSFRTNLREMQKLLHASTVVKVPALKQCVIVALFLGNNAVGDQGADALAEGLRHAKGLQELHLNDNEASCELEGYSRGR